MKKRPRNDTSITWSSAILLSLLILMPLAIIFLAPIGIGGGNPLDTIAMINGSTGGDRLGWNVSYAGDVNDDGIDDIIVGAPYNDSADGSKADAGAAYIFFGHSDINLSDINASNADVSIYGESAGDHFGWDVSDLGNVNSDTIDDVIIGAPDAGISGRAYIFYGRASWSSSYDATDANVTLTGESIGDRFGHSVSGARDFDNSNYNDIIVGAPGYDKNNWWDNGWSYCKKLTLDNSGQSESLENFTILVTLSSSNFNYSKAKSDGTDLRFIDSDNATELKYHIEEWNSSGTSYVWVNVTNIAAASSSGHIWMYYGNPAASDVRDVSGTYDDNFVMVQHLNETSGTHYDATSNDNDGTPISGVIQDTTGVIDGADEFDSIDDYIDFGNDNSLDITDAITIEAWVNNQFKERATGLSLEASKATGFDIEWSCAAIADVDNDGELEIVVGSADNNLYVFNHSGSVLSVEASYLTVDQIKTSPAIADVDGDGMLEIVVGGKDWNVSVFNHSGSVLSLEAYYTTGDQIEGSSPAIADVDDDGTLEIVIGSKDKSVYVLNHSGSVLSVEASYATGDQVKSSPVIADVDGDGILEIVIGSKDSNVYVLNHSGSSLLEEDRYPTGDWIEGSTAAIADVDDDGILEIVIGSKDFNVYVLNHSGSSLSEEASYDTEDEIKTSPAIADVDGDGMLEIVVGSKAVNVATTLYVFNHSGSSLSVEASYATGTDIEKSSPAIADVDDDGTLEIVVGSKDLSVYVFNHSGSSLSVEASFATGDQVKSSPAIADVDGDGILEIVIGSKDDSVYVLGTDSHQVNLTWDRFHKDLNNTGYFKYPYVIVNKEDSYGIWPSTSGIICSINFQKFNVSTSPGWKYVVLTYDKDAGGDQIKLYINGTLEASQTLSEPISINTNSLTIGNYFNGSIDEVRISTTSRTADWISAQYLSMNAGFTTFGSEVEKDRGRAYIFYGDGSIPTAAGSADKIYTGENASDEFGFSVSNAGDVNNDGNDDVIVGAPFNDDGGTNTGKAYLYYGVLGSLTFTGENAGDNLGWSVANVSDIDEDGLYDDVIIGAPGYNSYSGRAYIYHGGSPMNNVADLTLTGKNTGDNFGYSVHDAGDIDYDGSPDVIVGAPYNDSADGSKTDCGAIYIYCGGSGMDSTANYTNYGEYTLDHFGSSVSGAGNVNGDGYDDVLVGAPDNDDGGTNAGKVYVLSILSFVITDVSATPVIQESGGYVNITCNVTAVAGVNGAWVNITLPGGGYINVSMTQGLGDLWYYNTTYTTPGQHQYTIWANDTNNNWISSSGHSYTIQDITLPEISNVLDTPDIQETGGWVNITGDVTDNINVYNVWVNITLPGGGYTNVSMTQGTGNQWYDNNTYATLGLYQYTLWVNDTSDNWNSSSGYSFTIQDTTLPEISNVLDTPDPQEVGSSVNITCDVTDNVNVDNVWVNITLPGGGYTNVSMIQGVGNQWYYNTTYAALGQYQYTIWANDTSDNWNSSSGYSFTIQDTLLPEISNVLDVPDPQETGSWVNITCDVIDNINIYNVWVTITLPGGGNINGSMIQGAGNQWYYNNNYVPLGLYQYTIWVNDTSDNWNSSSGHSFTIQDTTLPEISSVLDVPDPQETGGSVNISCDVTDNIGVYGVWVNITLPGGGYTNVSMIQGIGSQWYYYNTYAPLGLYQYTIWVNDTSDNWNSSSGYSFTIQDTTLPEIFNVLDVPDPQAIGGYINISSDVTDNVGVSNVWVNITLPGGGYTNVSMTQGAGNQWYYNNTYVLLGQYQYTVWTNDTLDNWNSSSGYTFRIGDTTLPEISNVLDTPDPQETGGYINISSDITDNVGVINVWVNITLPGGGYTNVSMSQGAGNQWFYDNAYATLGVYSYVIWVNDTSNNWNSSSGYSFSIEDTTLPEIKDIVPKPSIQILEGYVNISCNVTDTVGVDGVWVDIPGVGNFSLDYDPVSGNYYYNDSYDTEGTYDFTIWANDTSNNWAKSSISQFAIINREPTLSSGKVDPSSGFIDSWFNFTVIYTDLDDHAPGIITVNITGLGVYSLLGVDAVDNDHTDGKLYYYNITNIPTGTYTFHFAANDLFGYWNETLDALGPDVTPKPGILDCIGYITEFGDDIYLNATLLDFDNNPITGENITFYIDINKNGMYEAGELAGIGTTLANGNVSVGFIGNLAPASYDFTAVYNGSGDYVVNDDFALLIINAQPAMLIAVSDIAEQGKTILLTATLMDGDGNPIVNEDVAFYLDANMNGIYEGSELIGSSLTSASGVASVNYIVDLTSANYGFWARYTGSINYTVSEIVGLLTVQNTGNTPPAILGIVPDQIKEEDSPPWILDLTSYEDDLEDSSLDLKWYLTGIDTSLYLVMGMNSSDDVFTFIPMKDAYGNDEVTLWLKDSGGAFDSQKLWVNITSVNDKPYFNPYPPNLIVHYHDPSISDDDPFTWNYTAYVHDIETQPSDLIFTTSADTTDLGNGYITVDGMEATFIYPYSLLGDIIAVTLTIFDGEDEASTIITVKVASNWAPRLIENPPDITLEEKSTLLNAFDLDDYFWDRDNDTLFYASGQSHVDVRINPDNTVDFSSLSDWFGSEYVTFRGQDPTGAIIEATILVTVLSVNDPPVIEGVPDITVRFNETFVFDLSPYVSDADNSTDELLIRTSQPQDNIWVSTQNNLLLMFNYPEDKQGLDIPVTIWVSDGINETSQSIVVTVSDNYPPTLAWSLPDVSFNEDESLNNVFDLDLFFFEMDDGDVLSYTYESTLLLINISSSGSVDFSAPPDWYGSEEVTFRATDLSGAIVEDTITVTVIPVNDAPFIEEIPEQVADKDETWILDLSSYISDIDHELNELEITVQSSEGEQYITVSGHFLILQYPGGVQKDTVTVTVSDGISSSSKTFSVVIETTKHEKSYWEEFLGLWVLLVTICLILIELIVSRIRLGKFMVQEVFVIHENGLLIAHATVKSTDTTDNVDEGGMLIAGMNFIREGLERGDDSTTSTTQVLGKYLIAEKGERLYMLVVHTGDVKEQAFTKIKNVIDKIEDHYSEVLVEWQGDPDDFVGIDVIIGGLLGGLKGDVSPKPEDNLLSSLDEEAVTSPPGYEPLPLDEEIVTPQPDDEPQPFDEEDLPPPDDEAQPFDEDDLPPPPDDEPQPLDEKALPPPPDD